MKQQNRGQFDEMVKSQLNLQYDTQPFFADFNGDLKLDILFTDTAGSLKVAFQVKDSDYDMTIKDFIGSVALSKAEADYCLDPVATEQLSKPHSATYVDLDGDCMPDLFLTRKNGDEYTFEIYIQTIKNKEQRYCLVQKSPLKVDTFTLEPPMIDFADIDRDAMFDMVFYQDKHLYTLFNKMKAQSPYNADLCRKAASEEALRNYKIFDNIPQTESEQYDTEYVSRQSIQVDTKFNMLEPSANGVPGRVRIGDIDADGYPDLLLTIAEKTHHSASQNVQPTAQIQSKTYLMRNSGGDACHQDAHTVKRCFVPSTSEFDNEKDLENNTTPIV